MPDQEFNKKTSIITISGIVQGVGFRPFIWQVANDMGLTGEVLNNGQGVQILINFKEGEEEKFLNRVKTNCPPLANITKIETGSTPEYKPFKNFKIRPSEQGEMRTQISPDAATCKACLDEVKSPEEHRYHYPFTNCTHCGPRLSIIYEAPYDRATTSMAPFEMCPICKSEYENPNDRRFHAQPIACPNCGPQLELVWLNKNNPKPKEFDDADPLISTANLIKAGYIGAIKGLGGFHLSCVANNEALIEELRLRKKRSNKAFALMCKDREQAKLYGQLSKTELELLESPAAPIVLVKKGQISLPEAIAPGLGEVGIMLPNTPLHHLLLAEFDEPLIMTSGNISNMPQLITNEEALNQLNEVADFALLHNRHITNRVDDSVVRVVSENTTTLRRARGYAPAPIPLPKGFEKAPDILGLGAELKSTFCMVKNQEAIISQHLGDLEHVPTFDAYQQTIALYTDLFDFTPEHRVIDEHPEYLSSKYGGELNEKDQTSLIKVQHHHAHMASTLGENEHEREEGKCLGLILDGLGFGQDGTIWGGELLLGDYTSFKRIGAFEAVPLIGGSAAVKEPWRNLFAHLETGLGWEAIKQDYSELAAIEFIARKPISTLRTMIEKNMNSPLSSSCGRLFDAVAASLELSMQEVTYEGEAAMNLEALFCPKIAKTLKEDNLYKANFIKENHMIRVCFSPLWSALLTDLKEQKTKSYIATQFHISLTHILLEWLEQSVHNLKGTNNELSTTKPIKVALSGGCFQNKTLLEFLVPLLEKNGFKPLTQSQLPANDGGLSYGQALIAAAQILKTEQL